MTEATPTAVVPDVEIVRRLDELTDLFRRRMLDDRSKTEFLQELQERARTDDRVIVGRLLRPLTLRLLGMVDRIDNAGGPPNPLAESVVDELLMILEEFGIHEISAEGMFDSRLHRVVGGVVDGRPGGTIARVDRRGVTLDGIVLRYSDVIVSNESAPDGAYGE